MMSEGLSHGLKKSAKGSPHCVIYKSPQMTIYELLELVNFWLTASFVLRARSYILTSEVLYTLFLQKNVDPLITL